MGAGDGARTRAADDIVAESDAALRRGSVEDSPFELAAVARFADRTGPAARTGRPGQSGLVGDLGCGPGRLTAALRAAGLDVVGLDLSPAMVAISPRTHPDVPVAAGAQGALPLATDGCPPAPPTP